MRLSVVPFVWRPRQSEDSPPSHAERCQRISGPATVPLSGELLCSAARWRYAEHHGKNCSKVTVMSPKSAATATLLAGLLMTPGFGRAQEPDSFAQAADAVDPVRQPGANPFSPSRRTFSPTGSRSGSSVCPTPPTSPSASRSRSARTGILAERKAWPTSRSTCSSRTTRVDPSRR